MDGTRFDAWSRSLADQTSRRQMLRPFSAGGLKASLLGLAGLRNAAAQSDDYASQQQCLSEGSTW